MSTSCSPAAGIGRSAMTRDSGPPGLGTSRMRIEGGCWANGLLGCWPEILILPAAQRPNSPLALAQLLLRFDPFILQRRQPAQVHLIHGGLQHVDAVDGAGSLHGEAID